MMKIGTSGFRGIIGDEFTKEQVVKIIQCVCNQIDKKSLKKEVIVGYDNRFMSEVYAKWICEVFAGNGVKTIYTQTSVPSPLVSLMTKKYKNDFGIMVTASHNPYYYNGIKVFVAEGKEPDSELEKILNTETENITLINALDYDLAIKNGLVTTKDYTSEFVTNIVNLLKFKSNFKAKVLFNVMNGSSLNAIMELKKQLNLTNLDVVNTNRDALFNLDGPIPNEDKLQDFKKYALEKGYDFAFATDGDGDRIALFDEKGNFYCGNELNALIYYFTVKEKKQTGPVVKNVTVSKLVENVANLLGEKAIETKIGFKNVTEALVNNNALVGAENSGSEIKGHTFCKDGLIVFALALEILEYYKKPFSEIFADLKKQANYNMSYKETSIKVASKENIINYLNNNTPNFNKKIVSTSTLDGYKYYFEDGAWLSIRFSGTENLLRIVAETNTKEELERIIETTFDIIKAI